MFEAIKIIDSDSAIDSVLQTAGPHVSSSLATPVTDEIPDVRGSQTFKPSVSHSAIQLPALNPPDAESLDHNKIIPLKVRHIGPCFTSLRAIQPPREISTLWYVHFASVTRIQPFDVVA